MFYFIYYKSTKLNKTTVVFLKRIYRLLLSPPKNTWKRIALQIDINSPSLYPLEEPTLQFNHLHQP